MKYPAGSVSNDREKGVHTPLGETKQQRAYDSSSRMKIMRQGGPRRFLLTVVGKPIGYTRMTQRSKFVDSNAQAYLAYQEEVRLRAKEAGAEIFEGPLGIEVRAYMRNRRSDISNILKGIEDSLNKVCYTDDYQIIDAHAVVIEGDGTERVSVVLWEMK